MRYESKCFIEAASMEWQSVDPGVKRKIMGYNDEIMMVQVHFDKDGIGTLHKHRHSQTTYVVSGKFEVTVGDEKKVLVAGDGFYIPPEAEHGAVCLDEGVLIDVFSPVREDFL